MALDDIAVTDYPLAFQAKGGRADMSQRKTGDGYTVVFRRMAADGTPSTLPSERFEKAYATYFDAVRAAAYWCLTGGMVS